MSSNDWDTRMMGQKLGARLRRVATKFSSEVENQPILRQVEQSSGVSKGRFVLAVSVCLCVLIFLMTGADTFLHLVYVAVVLPFPLLESFRSISAIEEKSTQTEWLVYWFIFAFTELLGDVICLVSTAIVGPTASMLFGSTYQMIRFLVLFIYLVADDDLREGLFLRGLRILHKSLFNSSVAYTRVSADSVSAMEGGLPTTSNPPAVEEESKDQTFESSIYK